MSVFNGLLVLHVAAGAVGLIALWVPLIGRKGSPRHKWWGRVFSTCLLATGAFAIGMSLCTLAAPFETHPKLDDIVLIRGLFGWMMLYLSTFTMALAWFGVQCVRNKRDHARHRNPLTLGLLAATVLTALACAGYGALHGEPLMIAIALLGITTAALNMRFILTPAPAPNEWLVQHMRALVGAGVSVYTAFFSFGAANLLPQVAFSPVLWAAPTIAGIAVIIYHQARIRGQVAGRRSAARVAVGAGPRLERS